MVAGDGPHGFVPPTLIPCRVGHPRLCPVVGSPSVNSGGKTYYQGGPGSGVIHLSLSSVVVLPCTPPYHYIIFLLLILLLLAYRYAILWTEKRSVPCLQPIVGACGLKSTGGRSPQGCEIPLRLDPSVRMDLVPQPETEGMRPVVSICNNGGAHRSPPSPPRGSVPCQT